MNKKILFLISAFLLLQSATHAQIEKKIFGNPEDYNGKFKRTLVVQLLEEDPDMVKHMEKKADKWPDDLPNYRAKIAAYNDAIKKVVDKLWKLNSTIEYKTESELKELRKSKDAKKYMVLYTYDFKDLNLDFKYDPTNINTFQYAPNGPINDSKLKATCLCYSGAENRPHDPDYKIYLPLLLYKEKPQVYSEGELMFALKAMQNNIAEIVSTKKKITFDDYAENEAAKNCSQLKSKKLLVDQSLVSKKFKTIFKEEDVKIATDNYVMVSNDEIAESLKNESDELVTLFLPYGTEDGMDDNSKGFGKDKIIVCLKLIVNSKTGDIFGYATPSKMIGINSPSHLQKKDFKDFAKCK